MDLRQIQEGYQERTKADVPPLCPNSTDHNSVPIPCFASDITSIF
jgi:hypothetical protein